MNESAFFFIANSIIFCFNIFFTLFALAINLLFVFQLLYSMIYANKTIFTKKLVLVNIAILTLTLFYYNFSTICVREDLAFCLLINTQIIINIILIK